MELISIIRPFKNSANRVFHIPGFRLLTMLCLQLNDQNGHRLRRAVECLTLVCICGLANEDSEHFFSCCRQYHALLLKFLGQIRDIPGIDITCFDNRPLCTLVYGNSSFTEIDNSIIIVSTIFYSKGTGKLNFEINGTQKSSSFVIFLYFSFLSTLRIASGQMLIKYIFDFELLSSLLIIPS